MRQRLTVSMQKQTVACLQLVGLSSRLGRVTCFRRRRVEDERRRGGGGVLGAAGLQSVSHCGRRLQRLGRQSGLSGPGDGRWDWRNPVQAITVLPQLSGRTSRGRVSATAGAVQGVSTRFPNVDQMRCWSRQCTVQ